MTAPGPQIQRPSPATEAVTEAVTEAPTPQVAEAGPDEAPAPAPAKAPVPATSNLLQPAQADWRSDYVRVREPKWKGTGLIITGAVGFTALGISQTTLTSICGEPYCEGAGIHQRVIVGTSLGLLTAGAWKKGRNDAYRDTLGGKTLGKKQLRTRKAAGFATAAVGLLGLAVDFGLHTQCFVSGEGPYALEGGEFFFPTCRGVTSGIVMDLSAAAAAIGLGFGMHAVKYDRDRKFYRNARVAVGPTFGPNDIGLAVQGQF